MFQVSVKLDSYGSFMLLPYLFNVVSLTMYEYINRNRIVICAMLRTFLAPKLIHWFLLEHLQNLQTYVYAINNVSSQIHSCCLEPLSRLQGHCCEKPENAAAVGNHVDEGASLFVTSFLTHFCQWCQDEMHDKVADHVHG